MPIEEQIIGEADVSRAATVRKQINKLIKGLNQSDFDLAELFFEADDKRYYNGWGFDSFSKWAKSLEIKYTKAYYLLAIQKTMKGAGLTRAEFEPVGKTKLRMISELSRHLDKEHNGTPITLLARELTLKAKDMEPEAVRYAVDEILGLTEDESFLFITFKVKKSAKDNVITPGLRKAKLYMGQTKDEESGEFKDASDGAALEMVMANFLADSNFDTPEEESVGGTTESSQQSSVQQGQVALPELQQES